MYGLASYGYKHKQKGSGVRKNHISRERKLLGFSKNKIEKIQWVIDRKYFILYLKEMESRFNNRKLNLVNKIREIPASF